MQVIGDCGPYEDGEYYDVVAGSCTLRFDMSPQTAYEGRTILHCHILAHEDQGAMAWMDVIGGEGPPVFPVNSDIGTVYGEYYSLGTGNNPPAAPGSLSAAAISSSQIDLSWSDNSTDETGFDIEGSTDGANFTLITSTAANTTGFSDSGLNPSSTYFYRVSAYNSNGNSTFSNTSSATTQPQTAGTSVQVGSITVSTLSQGKGQKSGRAVVVVVDDQGAAVAGATVTGDFSGGINETGISGNATDGNGSTTIDSSQSAKGVKSLSFCVTAITHATLQDFAAAPGTVCGAL